MAFRNINFHVPRETSASSLYEIKGDVFTAVDLNLVLPSSSDYSLKDLLASGVKVPPVDPTIVHDSTVTSVVADSLINNSESFVDNSNPDKSE